MQIDLSYPHWAAARYLQPSYEIELLGIRKITNSNLECEGESTCLVPGEYMHRLQFCSRLNIRLHT